MVHAEEIEMSKNGYGDSQPVKGDYLQLLDANNQPCENHAVIERWTAQLGIQLYLVEDTYGESFACTRLPEMDNQVRNAWQQVITSAPTIGITS